MDRLLEGGCSYLQKTVYSAFPCECAYFTCYANHGTNRKASWGFELSLREFYTSLVTRIFCFVIDIDKSQSIA